MMKSFFKKSIDILFSTRAAGLYLVLFAFVIGIATFIENDFGTSSAQALVFKAKWFELLLLLFMGSIITNIFRFKMVKNKKWAHLTFHLAIIIIILGAGITRYFSYEGMMNIREGGASNSFLSAENYLKFKAIYKNQTYSFDEQVLFSLLGNNNFDKKFQIEDKLIKVKLKDFIPNPVEQIISDPKGIPIVKVVVVGSEGREDHYIKQGGSKLINGVEINFSGNEKSGAINLKTENGNILFSTDKPVIQTIMAAQKTDTILPTGYKPLIMKSMYKMGDFSFVTGDYNFSGIVKLISGERKMKSESYAGLDIQVSEGNKVLQKVVTGIGGAEGKEEIFDLGDLQLAVSYGAKRKQLPFSIGLRDFIMERYPGTENASSYASEVTLMDPGKNVNFDYRIYMNHILNYGGYRFFQSSFDRDELGTYLSVNHDFWGTLVSYIGYFLLTLGMVLTLIAKNSRFSLLLKKFNNIKKKEITIAGMIIFLGFSASDKLISQDPVAFIDKEQAAKLGKMIVQDNNGRFKPMNTMTSELMRKISKHEELFGLNSDQIIWSMMKDPMKWTEVKIINLGREEEVKKLLGTDGKMASYSQFFSKEGDYILHDKVSEAQNKNPKDQGVFDKAIIKLDEKINVVNMILSLRFLKIFPVPDHPNDAWISPAEIRSNNLRDTAILANYNLLSEFMTEGKRENLDLFIDDIKKVQQKYTGKILPSDNKIDAELLLNKMNIFNNLMKVYGLLSMIILAFFFYSVLWSKNMLKFTKYTWWVVFAVFLLQTFGIALRWYISGRAPWSNGYESMVYIAWMSMLAGLLLSRKSLGGIAATLVLTATILSVAAMSWLDPEITPLVPVLKSYWLTIHVAMIAGSYGFLLLGAFIAILNLVLMILSNEANKSRLLSNIKELTIISEIILLVGLIMMSIGTYLGGVWANESWGRYWGWDAKETWALVTVLVYSFILHMRLIPGLQSIFAYNFATLFGFATVIMTFLGVNYYLSGLHSYAAGDPVPIPSQVYYVVVFLTSVSGLAYYKYNKLLK
jgi:cytochrome c-type biogenesis protein CcsB